MIIKEPAVYDVSHWKEILDFTKVNPRPFLFITKATEGTGFVDSKFVRFFRGMASIGVFRGAYHFNRKAYDPQAQAKHFCDTVRPELVNSDLVILDIEEGGEIAAKLITWFQYVRAQFPKNIMVIYSRKNILDVIPMTQTQKDYFRNNVVTWTAGYPTNPDMYSVVPSFYVPDQTKYAPVGLWQYSEKGVVAGIDGAVDLNWISEELKTRIGGVVTPPPPGDKMTYLEAVGNAYMKTGDAKSYPNAQINGVNQFVITGDIIETSERSAANGYSKISRIWRGGQQAANEIELPPVAWFYDFYTKPSDFTPPVDPPTGGDVDFSKLVMAGRQTIVTEIHNHIYEGVLTYKESQPK